MKGAVVLLHSALRTLGHVDGGAKALVDALRSVLGPPVRVAAGRPQRHFWNVVDATRGPAAGG